MVDTLLDGFRQYIDQQAAWIRDDQTRRIAKQKADLLAAVIGYVKLASDDDSLNEYYSRVRGEDARLIFLHRHVDLVRCGHEVTL